MTDNSNIYATYVERLHQAAANGDVTAITDALKVLPDVDAINSHGWTALMFATRNGHREAAAALLSKGADTTLTNSVGQNALDIAEFWQYRTVAALLSKSDKDDASAVTTPLPVVVRKSNYFCDNPLDRMSNRRSDEEWLAALKTNPNTVYVILTQLQPLVKANPEPPPFSLIRFSYDKVKRFLTPEALLILLGVEQSYCEREPGLEEAVGWFAVDGGILSDNEVKELDEGATLLSSPLGYFQMTRSEAAIAGQARSLIAWHERCRFCSTCGSPTKIGDAGYKRTCVSDICPSNKGVHNTSYPRTDPTVIMAVMSPDRSQILLGRGKRFPAAMWSCLAGFMEPGESIEEACRREVHEESGVQVGRVDYHSCQPWPMPNSLMIGCIAQAETTVIKVDKEELEDAKWFSASEVRSMVLHQHPLGYFCPPEQAIAHQLIKYWLNNMCKL